MSKDFIYRNITGFYKPELVVEFINFEIIKKCVCFTDKNKYIENYDIVFIEAGRFDFICEGRTKVLKPGDVFIARPFENFEAIGLTEAKNSAITHISFHQSLFEKYNSDKYFLRPFVERQRGHFNLYRGEEFKEFSIYEIINRLKVYNQKNMSMNAFVLAVGMLITELCITFDNKIGKAPTENSDDYMLKVYDYIKSNCLTDIKIEDIMKKFSVSHWYINKVTNKFYGFSFRRMVKDVKMWQAQKYMSENIELKEVASLCGFADYSGFYRAYKIFFGLSPSEDLKYFKTHNHFDSYNWWKQ